MGPKRYVSFDIDGILNDYPQCWVDYVNSIAGTDFKSKEEIKERLPTKDYANIKDMYRSSEYKENLKINSEAISLISQIRSKGVGIILATSRPIKTERYPDLENLTRRWLDKNKVSYDLLLRKHYDLAAFKDLIIFHVDDDAEDAIKVSQIGVSVVLYAKGGNDAVKSDRVGLPLIHQLGKVKELLSQYEIPIL